MKILIVHGCTVFDHIGGSEVQLNYIGEFLRSRGHLVFFYTMDCMPDRPPVEERDGFRLYRNNSIRLWASSFCYHIRRILHIVRETKAALLFARSLGSAYILHAASKKAGIPFVYQLPCMFDERMYAFGGVLQNIRKSGSGALNAFLAPRCFWRADRVLTICEDDATKISTHFKISARAIYNMHPVPLTRARKSANPLRIVWINNCKPLKRPEMFVELARRCADMKAQFIMAGAIPQGVYGKRLRDMVVSTPNVEYRGQISLADSNQLLDTAGLNVVTSRNEGFGNGNIQGWLRETPVITTVDRDQVVVRNRIGFAVEDIDEMEEKLRYLYDNPRKRIEMGRRARRYAIENHSMESQGPKYLRAFEEVCKRRAADAMKDVPQRVQ